MNRQNFKGNRPLIIGGAASFACFGIGHFIGIPEFFKGLLIGICLVCYGAALFSQSSTRMRKWKRGLIQRSKAQL